MMINQNLNVQLLNQDAVLPSRGSDCAAGLDLYSCDEIFIDANSRAIISTGVAVEIPTGTYGRIAPRSGLAVKKGLDVGAGVCDSDFRGEIKVLLFNHSDDGYLVKKSDRIAQLIITPYVHTSVTQVDVLDETKRGDQGFGSTGF